METSAHPQAQPHQTRDRLERGSHGNPKPQRVLAHEPQLIQSPPPAPSPFRCAPGLLPSSQSVSRLPPPLGCIVQQALSNQRLKEQGVPELRLPCRDSGIQ